MAFPPPHRRTFETDIFELDWFRNGRKVWNVSLCFILLLLNL